MMQQDLDPIELNISVDKIRDIVLKSRQFELEILPDEPEPGSDLTVVEDREELLDQGEDPTEAELRELIDDLNEDEAIDLIALAWVGRGDFTRNEWEDARALARERDEASTSSYLMGMPTLADYLNEGVSALGYDPESFEPD
ncbi:MAG: DUF3775 domain-containing protein [Acetobacteraceae bacterium]